MIEGLSVEVWTRLGVGGLLTLVVVLILTGRLVPRSTVDRTDRQNEQRMAELREALDKREQQIDRMLPGYEVTVQLLRSIKSKAES